MINSIVCLSCNACIRPLTDLRGNEAQIDKLKILIAEQRKTFDPNKPAYCCDDCLDEIDDSIEGFDYEWYGSSTDSEDDDEGPQLESRPANSDQNVVKPPAKTTNLCFNIPLTLVPIDPQPENESKTSPQPEGQQQQDKPELTLANVLTVTEDMYKDQMIQKINARLLLSRARRDSTSSSSSD